MEFYDMSDERLKLYWHEFQFPTGWEFYFAKTF